MSLVWTLCKKNHDSIEGKVLDIKLTRKRNEISCYDDEGYRRFTSEYLPVFADTLQYTLSFVILPMLKWVNPRQRQMGHALFRQRNTSFIDLLIVYQIIVERCIELSGTVQMMNPHVLAEDHFNKIRFQHVVARLQKKFKNE